jgi:hypothetical protein
MLAHSFKILSSLLEALETAYGRYPDMKVRTNLRRNLVAVEFASISNSDMSTLLKVTEFGTWNLAGHLLSTWYHCKILGREVLIALRLLVEHSGHWQLAAV